MHFYFFRIIFLYTASLTTEISYSFTFWVLTHSCTVQYLLVTFIVKKEGWKEGLADFFSNTRWKREREEKKWRIKCEAFLSYLIQRCVCSTPRGIWMEDNWGLKDASQAGNGENKLVVQFMQHTTSHCAEYTALLDFGRATRPGGAHTCLFRLNNT